MLVPQSNITVGHSSGAGCCIEFREPAHDALCDQEVTLGGEVRIVRE